MKKLVVLALVLSSATITGNLLAFDGEPTVKLSEVAQKTAKFTIENMTCKVCDITVRKAMEKVDGVIKATVDYDTKTATVIYDPSKATLEDIAEASTNVGYKATAI